MAIERDGQAVQEIGGTARDFRLEDLSGSRWNLHEIAARGHAAVVVFWSCICSHCVRYDEYLNSLPQRYPGVALLAVASRQQETPDQLRRAALERRLTFPILLDEGGRVAKQWFAEQTPRAYLIGSDLALRYRGAIDNFQIPGDPDYIAYLDPAIADLLTGRPIGQPDTPSFGCAIQSVYYDLQKIV